MLPKGRPAKQVPDGLAGVDQVKNDRKGFLDGGKNVRTFRGLIGNDMVQKSCKQTHMAEGKAVRGKGQEIMLERLSESQKCRRFDLS